MLVAVPSGADTLMLMTSAHSLQNGFIRYLQEKQAAGIVNIYQPSTNQVNSSFDHRRHNCLHRLKQAMHLSYLHGCKQSFSYGSGRLH